MDRASKAVVWREGRDSVAVEEVRVRGPGPGEVTVRMAACGVCHSDLSATNGTIPIPPPLVLGHEGAGVVVEVGEGVTALAEGDHVVSTFVNMCGACRWCTTGHPALCEQDARSASTLPDGSTPVQDADGEPVGVFSGCGTMSEYATLHTGSLVRIDPDVPLARAALLGCGVMTGVGAVFNTARVEPGSTAVVFGAGGVGLSAIQACALAGAAMTVAVDPVPAKRELACAFGATHTLDPTAESNVVRALRKLTGGGADYAFECVGNGEVVAQAYGALGKRGVCVVVGVAPPKDKTTITTATLTYAEKTLTGSYFGSARPLRDFPRLIALYRSGRLKLDELVTAEYPVEDAPRAFADLAAARNARGVVVFS
ncbi:MAG TPA: Zn-dependent alcohol dehydrogenase [Longimicrobiales bacterium]|nr:Zn-dependent alcohol dehydrogenase [Longimicrobiales bacterium]